MLDAIEAHIAAVRAFYRPLLTDNSRLSGSDRLYAGFEQSVAAYRKIGRRQVSGLIERVNELAVAHQLLTDAQLAAAHIVYEPQLIPGPKFDFVLRTPAKPTLYIEVKTVSPQSANDATSWQKATYRRRMVTPREPGGTSAAQAAFQRYTVQTQAKLAAHAAIEPGDGLLIFCGDGLTWLPSALTDFIASYRGPLRIGLLIRRQDEIAPCHPGQPRTLDPGADPGPSE